MVILFNEYCIDIVWNLKIAKVWFQILQAFVIIIIGWNPKSCMFDNPKFISYSFHFSIRNYKNFCFLKIPIYFVGSKKKFSQSTNPFSSIKLHNWGHTKDQVKERCFACTQLGWYRKQRRNLIISLLRTKGQLISKCPFGFFKSTKKPTNFLYEFLP